ncbi:Piwi-domain-containing protein [Aureobasidium sp. EXF-12298]|nr:Piwi-domain-containing protein [Aureobasidium sp. EXF-12298]
MASAAFYKPGPPMNLVSELVSSHSRQASIPQNLVGAQAFIRMLRVKTDYLKTLDANSKPKKDAQGRSQTVPGFKSVVGLAPRPRNGGTRTLTSSPTRLRSFQAAAYWIVVFLHFKNQHATTLQRPALPVVNVGTRSDPSYLPIELASVLPGQPVRRLLSGSQTEHTLQFPARAPRLSAASITASPGNGLRTMSFNVPAQVMNNFGIDIGKELITVPGRILPTPKVYYKNKELQAEEGSSNLMDVNIFKHSFIGRRACVVINYNDQTAASVLDGEGILKALECHLGACGVCTGPHLQTQNINIPRPIEQSRDVIDKKLKEIFFNAGLYDIDLLFVVLQKSGKWCYSRMKFWGNVGLGVQSICSVVSRMQIPEGQDMFPGNLALQFNVEGGGVGNNNSNQNPAGVNKNKPSSRAQKQKARDEKIRNAAFQDVMDNGGNVPDKLKPQLKVVRKKTEVQKLLEKELLARNPEIIKKLKDLKKQISDLEVERDALQEELDDNKKSLSLIPKDEDPEAMADIVE